MTKKGLSLALFALLAITAHGQRFDWARTIDGYDQSSSNVANKIVGSMTDRGGNLYICAQYGWGASICGANLPDGGENGNMVVAKISPDGGMVWHKEIYGYRTTGGTAVGLLPMGDTAMMVCYKLIAPGYQEWIDSGGTMPFPGGESREGFNERSFTGFLRALGDPDREETIVVVCHGGNIMAILSRLTGEDYYTFMTKSLDGYRLELETDDEGITVHTFRRIVYGSDT